MYLIFVFFSFFWFCVVHSSFCLSVDCLLGPATGVGVGVGGGMWWRNGIEGGGAWAS